MTYERYGMRQHRSTQAFDKVCFLTRSILIQSHDTPPRHYDGIVKRSVTTTSVQNITTIKLQTLSSLLLLQDKIFKKRPTVRICLSSADINMFNHTSNKSVGHCIESTKIYFKRKKKCKTI
jgi:hypothetical protein